MEDHERCRLSLERRAACVSSGVGRLNTLVVTHGKGAVLFDVEGREYLDLASGIGVTTVGHSHPKVVEAIARQAGLLQHTCFHVATYEPYLKLCEKLIELFPHGDDTRAMLVNSGAEAVENAVKIARQYTGRPAIICFSEGFHGRTLLATTLTSKVGYKVGCGPYAPEVYRLPFPSFFHYRDGLDRATFVQRELKRLRDFFVNTVHSDQVAAIIVEPVQGEGGFNVIPEDYLKGLQAECRERGILLVLDEVQSGFCRTGRWAAYQHFDVQPDVTTWAKAMGGGMPVSAVVGRAEVMNGVRPGTLGGTYGGNPVACASALATIEVMEQEDLCARAIVMGKLIRARLEKIQKACPAVLDVRGLGAMLAMELREGASDIVGRCLERGVLVLTAGANGQVVRLLPPLVMSDEELAKALDVVEQETLAALATS
jgi:4-aminobutyrate aminotransferase / (S)-3-amino-2-methylpropionate transaminase / 5-aminovalerate transaminase